MTIRPIIASVSLLLGVVGHTNEAQEFNAAYEAYREAVVGQRYDVALEYAAQARRLGESLFPDDARKVATLLFNHGVVLGKLKRHDDAYPILRKARRLIGEAFGQDSQEVLNLHLALLNSAPRSAVRRIMNDALRLVSEHHDGDAKYAANIKVQGALRLWGRDTNQLLREAAAEYRTAGDADGHAMALFWIGKKHFSARKYDSVPGPMNAAVDALPERHPLALMARAHLVETYEALGQSDRATEHCLAIGRAKPWTGNDDYQPLFKRPPEYPPGALSSGRGGMVLMDFTVDEMGFVRDPKIVDSKGGKVFHQPAVEAAKGFRYAPRFVDGKAVAVPDVRQRIIFEVRR